jgi:pimeloyl-ACP methyl ester carboxylesterase
MEKLSAVPTYEKDHQVEGLFVKEVGPGEAMSLATPILMVHGACHGWWAYRKWMPFFAAAGWRCYALSLRNHPGSYAVAEEKFLRLKVEDYVADVVDVLNWINMPAILVGHSMGGIIVQKTAETMSPPAMVLLASVGPGQLGKIRDPLPAQRPFMFTAAQAREIWFHRIEDDEFKRIYARLVPESTSVINHYSSGELSVDHSKIHCPVLVVGAEFERTVVHRDRVIADFYSADRLLVPDAGHDFFLEPVAIDVAIRINHWLLSALPQEGLPLIKARQ